MELRNRTSYPARVFHDRRDRPTQRFATVVRVTFRCDASGVLTEVDRTDATAVWPSAMPTPWGTFPSDDARDRRGCDFVLIGSIVPPHPVTECVAIARAGRFETRLVAIGDRIWERTGRSGLQPSPPQPFTEMPLLLSRSFGGRAEPDKEFTDHTLNPAGRGYHGSVALALGRPLPNLESPTARIRNWDDRPTPICWGPVANAPVWQTHDWLAERRARCGDAPMTHAEGQVLMQGLHPAASPPAMLLTGLQAGETVEVTGVAQAALRFRVPEVGIAARASIGATEVTAPLVICGLWVLCPARLAVLTLRAEFHHDGAASDERHVTLEQVGRGFVA